MGAEAGSQFLEAVVVESFSRIERGWSDPRGRKMGEVGFSAGRGSHGTSVCIRIMLLATFHADSARQKDAALAASGAIVAERGNPFNEN